MWNILQYVSALLKADLYSVGMLFSTGCVEAVGIGTVGAGVAVGAGVESNVSCTPHTPIMDTLFIRNRNVSTPFTETRSTESISSCPFLSRVTNFRFCPFRFSGTGSVTVSAWLPSFDKGIPLSSVNVKS